MMLDAKIMANMMERTGQGEGLSAGILNKYKHFGVGNLTRDKLDGRKRSKH